MTNMLHIILVFYVYIASLCTLSMSDDGVISILATSSKKGGLMHFAGFVGSLMANPAASRLDIHLILDMTHSSILQPCLHTLNATFQSITVYNLEELDASPMGQRLRNETGDDRKFDSEIYKLDMINILSSSSPPIKRLILLDVDLLVLEDLSHLWTVPDEQPGKYFYLVNESYNDNGWYSKYSKKKHFPPPYGVSLGVMVADLVALKDAKLDGDKFVLANDEPVELPVQDIINTWAYYNPTKLGELSCRWNRRLESGCWDSSVITDAQRQDRGIVHGNKGIFHASADWESKAFEIEKKAHREFSHSFFQSCTEKSIRERS